MTVNYLLILIVLLLFAGFGVDAGMLEWHYLQMSAAVRASALSGSLALQRGGSSSAISASALNAAALNGFTNNVNGVSVNVQNPPLGGPYANNSYSVRSSITQVVPTSFMTLVGFPTVNLSSQFDHPGATPVSMTSSFNVYAIFRDTTSVTHGGFDNNNYAFSATALDAVRTSNNMGALFSWRGNLFFLAPPDGLTGAANTTISLTPGNFSQLLMLAGSSYGPYASAAFVVNYADGSTATANLAMSDWCISQSYANEVQVQATAYRLSYIYGADASCAPMVYGYSINLSNSKTVSSITLPNTRNIVVFAIDLMP